MPSRAGISKDENPLIWVDVSKEKTKKTRKEPKIYALDTWAGSVSGLGSSQAKPRYGNPEK